MAEETPLTLDTAIVGRGRKVLYTSSTFHALSKRYARHAPSVRVPRIFAIVVDSRGVL